MVRLRARDEMPPFPIVNVNDGRLMAAIENRTGVGEGLWHAVQRLTGVHPSGRHVAGVGEAREALVIAAVANDDIGNLALRRMSERLQQALYLPLLFQQIKSLHLGSN